MKNFFPQNSSAKAAFCGLVFLSLCGALLLAFLVPGSAEAATKERIRYYLSDHAGSPMRVITPEGFVVAKYRYAPMGEQLADKAAAGKSARPAFVGGLGESQDLVYLKHRYYNPLLGRFYQPDPVTFLSGGSTQVNRYVYGLNDSYTYSDADGRCPVCVYAAFLVVGAWMASGDIVTAVENPTSGNIMKATVSTEFALAGMGPFRAVLGTGTTLTEVELGKVAVASTTRQALPAPRQIEAAWGASTYRHGGLMTGIEHTMYRHGANSGFTNVSKFAEGTSIRDVSSFVDSALRYGRVTSSGTNAFTVEYNLGGTIGTDIGGSAASSIRVHIRDGIIQTAFPF